MKIGIHGTFFVSQEAYRRWVCSTLIPYFVEPNEIQQNQKQHSTSDGATTIRKVSSITEEIPFPAHSLSETLEDALVSKLLNR